MIRYRETRRYTDTLTDLHIIIMLYRYITILTKPTLYDYNVQVRNAIFTVYYITLGVIIIAMTAADDAVTIVWIINNIQ